MVSAVRTVLGDVLPDHLGVCDAHDHLFFGSPRLPGQELRSVPAARAELTAFRELGGGSVVQWTPYGLGRRAADLPQLSRETGVHVVAATGLHQAVHYDDGILGGLRGRLAEVFVSELTEGIGTSGVRAGLIKVAGEFHALDAHARWTMGAAAEAHHATGAPIAVHLELGTGALDVLDLLCGELGVPPERVVLGHLNRSPMSRCTGRPPSRAAISPSTDRHARTTPRTGACRTPCGRSPTRATGTGCSSAATPRPRRPARRTAARACRTCCAGYARASPSRWARNWCGRSSR
ncbi:hypothetical protein SALBM311S_07565 [Streptomyces alboniger]